MACDPLVPVTCLSGVVGDVVEGAGEAAATVVGNQFAQAMADGAAWVLDTTVGWWVDVPAVDLTTSPAETIRSYVLWLALAVATVGMIWQGIMLMVARRPDPLFGIGRGLFTLAIWAALGIVGPAAALRAGDAFASWVLDEATSGQAAERLTSLATLNGVTSPGAVIVLGLFLMLSGLVQAIIMIFREGAVVVLAGVVVLAAAGSFTNATRPWMHRVLGWMAALIAYKPIAALVYATALAMVGEGSDPRTLLVGLTMIVLAIVALPALMKFFTWTTGTAAAAGAGGGAAVLGASASAVHAVSAMSSSPASASSQAAHIRQDLGSPLAAGATTGGPALGAAPAPPVSVTTGAAASAPTGAAGAAPTSAGVAAGAAPAAAAGPAGAAVVAAQAGGAAATKGVEHARHHLTEGKDP